MIMGDDDVQIGNVSVKSISLDHPNGSIGYKITCENKSVRILVIMNTQRNQSKE